MTLGILLLLCRQMPDFFVRSLLWLRHRGRYRLQVIGLHHVPTDGAVILATNCASFSECLHVVAVTDRFTRFLFPVETDQPSEAPLLRYMARRSGLIPLPADPASAEWQRAVAKAGRSLKNGSLIGVTVVGSEAAVDVEKVMRQLGEAIPAAIVPVWCAAAKDGQPDGVRVVLGPPLKDDPSLADLQRALRGLAGITQDAEAQSAIGAMH
jgi:hypothetical protein